MSTRRRSDGNRAVPLPWPLVGLAVLVALFGGAAGVLSQNGPAVAAESPPEPAIFHVALDGSDDNAGTKEKPFATLERTSRPFEAT